MKWICFAVLLHLAAAKGYGQSIWQGMVVPRCPLYQYVLADSLNESIYCYGLNGVGGVSCTPFASDVYVWQQGMWDSITSLPGTMKTMVLYHDSLVIGGSFEPFPNNNILCHVNGELTSLGDFNNGVSRLRVIEDTLYAVGGFTMVDGQPTRGVAKRVGGHWVPVGSMPDNEPLVNNIIKYEGELIITGACYSMNGHLGIYHLVNGVWELLGDALVGLTSQAGMLQEYQGVLYIGGSISMAEGNVGHGIISWDGSSYHNVGGGLLWNTNDYNTLTGVRALEVRDGLLYCGGGFNYADDLESHGIAAWDGTNWCAVNGNLMETASDYVNDMVFLGDSLYVGCGPNIDGMEVGFAARAAVSELLGDCQHTAIPDETSAAGSVALQPNPANDQVRITTKTITTVVISDALGRIVWNEQVNTSTAIDVSTWPPGLYTVRTGNAVAKLIVSR